MKKFKQVRYRDILKFDSVIVVRKALLRPVTLWDTVETSHTGSFIIVHERSQHFVHNACKCTRVHVIRIKEANKERQPTQRVHANTYTHVFVL